MEEIKITIWFKPGSDFQSELGRTILDSTAKATTRFLESRHKETETLYELEILEKGTVSKLVDDLSKKAEEANAHCVKKSKDELIEDGIKDYAVEINKLTNNFKN